jgi:hypothetical protein
VRRRRQREPIQRDDFHPCHLFVKRPHILSSHPKFDAFQEKHHAQRNGPRQQDRVTDSREHD